MFPSVKIGDMKFQLENFGFMNELHGEFRLAANIVLAVKLLAFVGDDVLWLSTGSGD